MEHLAQPLLDLIKAHQNWAITVMFITAFGESFAFIGLLFPGTTLLIAAGALINDGTLPYVPVMLGAIAGAVRAALARRPEDGGAVTRPCTGCEA